MNILNFPKKPGEYKLSQLIIREQPTTIFGNKNTFHQDHIRKALHEQGITYPYIPVHQGEEFMILGGGKIRLDPQRKLISEPYNKMIGYNKTPNAQLTKQLLETLNYTTAQIPF